MPQGDHGPGTGIPFDAWLFETLVENAPDAVLRLGPDLRFLYANAAAERLSGHSRTAFAGRTAHELGTPQQLLQLWIAKVEEVLATRRAASAEFVLEGPAGRRVIESWWHPEPAPDGGVRSVLIVSREITARLEQHEQSQRDSKLASVAVLAGGIAHDFNNMLTAILGNLGLMHGDVADRPHAIARIRAAEEAAERARDLALQLLTFSRGGEPVKKPVQLSEVLRQGAAFALRGSTCRCDFEVQPDLWPADADAAQIGQVVQNLVLNASQSMPYGGTIVVRAINVGPADGAAQPLVRVSVADTGSGITAEDRPRIFDPFFSTRPERTGLGLTAVHSIVEKHGGTVVVESEPGLGTTITFMLPALIPQVARQAPRPPQEVRGRILVMDDEPLIREVIGLYLERQGYKAVLAKEGGEAVALYRAALDGGHRFDAVVMDLTVPGGMGGAEAIREIRGLDPDVRAIVASGYSSDPVMARHRDYGFQAALAKPFRASELNEALQMVLA